MRTLSLLAALVVAVPAAAQPSAADTALVRDVVDAYQFERAMSLSFGQGGLPPFAQGAFRADALEDSLAAAFLRNLRPDLLQDALVYLSGPTAEALYAQAEGLGGNPFALREAMEHPKESDMADEALTRRLVEALGFEEFMPHMMRRMFLAMADATPAMAADLEEEGGIDAVMEQFERELGDDFGETLVTYSRLLYHSLPKATLADAAAFYESEAGQYVSEIGYQATINAVVPMVVDMVTGMAEAIADEDGRPLPQSGPPPPPDPPGRPLPPPIPEPPTPEVFEVVEVQPELIGGLEGLQQRVVYPDEARREGIEGRVVVQFVVDEQGRVTEAVAVHSPDPRLSAAALAAVEGSQFTPGMVRGRPVKVRFAVPLTFRLRGAEAEEGTPTGWGQGSAGERDEEPPVLVGGLEGLQARVVYPEEARRQRIEGLVVVQFIVGKDGQIANEAVVQSPHPLLARAALDAVRQSQFEPARVDGEPVEVQFAVPVSFRLR